MSQLLSPAAASRTTRSVEPGPIRRRQQPLWTPALASLGRGALAGVVLFALSACASLPQIVNAGADTFQVRYDAQKTTPDQADAQARTLCNGPAELTFGETRFDGLSYRTYRCPGS